MPCCIRAVPHKKVVLSLRMESSTSALTVLSLGWLGLSLNVSVPRSLPLSSHLWTVCLVVLKKPAMLVTVKPSLESFLKAPLMPGDSLKPITKQPVTHELKIRCNVGKLTSTSLAFYSCGSIISLEFSQLPEGLAMIRAYSTFREECFTTNI